MITPPQNDKIAGIALWEANTFLLRWDNKSATFSGLPEEVMDTMATDGCPHLEIGRHQGLNNIDHFKLNQAAPGIIDFEVTERGFEIDPGRYCQRIVYCGTYTIWWQWEDSHD
jgi:hypothetical protein